MTNNIFKIAFAIHWVLLPLELLSQGFLDPYQISSPSFDIQILHEGIPPDTSKNGWLVNARDMILLKVYGNPDVTIQLLAEAVGFSEATFLPSPYRQTMRDTTYMWFRLYDLCLFGSKGKPAKRVSTFFIRFPEWKEEDPVFGTIIMLRTREPIDIGD